MKIGDKIKSREYPEFGAGIIIGFDNNLNLFQVRFEKYKAYIDEPTKLDYHYITKSKAILVEEKVEKSSWGSVLSGVTIMLIGTSLLKKTKKADHLFQKEEKKVTKDA